MATKIKQQMANNVPKHCRNNEQEMKITCAKNNSFSDRANESNPELDCHCLNSTYVIGLSIPVGSWTSNPLEAPSVRYIGKKSVVCVQQRAEPLQKAWLGEFQSHKDQRFFGMGLLGIDWINPNSPEFEP